MRTEETLRALLKVKGVSLPPERYEQALADLKGVAAALRMGENDDFCAILAALETWNLIGDERQKALQAGQVKHLLQLGQAVQDHVAAFGEGTEKALQGVRDEIERIGLACRRTAEREVRDLEDAGTDAHEIFEKKAAGTLAQMKAALLQSLSESKAELGRQVAATAQAAAKAEGKRAAGRFAAWLCAAVIAVLLAMGATLYLGHAVATAKGEAALEALKATEGFFESDAGQRLREAWESGELRDILMCRKKGWRVDDGYCIPGYFEKDGKRFMQGWKVIF